tara:strand:- start:66 stop:1355 length:1290 start_codon:yes stop_codon:yes gene_type:complete
MSKILGVDTSTIDNISGLGTGSGGIDPVPATTDTGIVMCNANAPVSKPFSAAELADYGNPAHMFQLSDITGVVDMTYNAGGYFYGALKSNGEFYVGVATAGYLSGLSSSDSSNAENNGGMFLSLSGVAKVVTHVQGFLAIKTDGTLWWSGQIGNILDSAAVGGGSTQINYGWLQVGSDTDWHDIDSYSNYPYQAIAIKGAAGSRYLYASGYGTSYGTGQGSTSSLKAWTRVKSSSGTDLNESMSVCKIAYSSCLAVADSGKLFSWGENAYGPLGDGSTTDKQYATQVGSATNWDNCWVQRNGGFAKNTLGEMWMSTSRSGWRIEPNTNKVFTQIGTDTDYQDISLYTQSQNTMDYTVFAKKGGSWYVSHDGIAAGMWAGSTAVSATTQGAWVAINDVLTQNDITGTIDHIRPYYSYNAQSSPSVMFALS